MKRRSISVCDRGLISFAAVTYGGDIQGLAVPLAARICAFAGTDEVCISRSVADSLYGLVGLSSAGDVSLKGILGQQQLFRVNHG